MRVGIVGASGYVGGELFRILVNHPKVAITAATSKQYDGEVIYRVHPNLKSFTDLRFTAPKLDYLTKNCDFVFTAVPHGSAVKIIPDLMSTGLKIVDMSADFRLRDPHAYEHWYHYTHPFPDMLAKTPLGIPEIYKEQIRNSKLVANPGCMAITSILGLAPFAKAGMIDLDHIVVDSKIGSSGGGTKPSMGTHHAERYGVVRPYKPVDHRHTAEIEQEISCLAGRNVRISMTPHAINMVRGILCTIHVFGTEKLETPKVWKALRDFYQDAPFVRFVKDKKGLAKYPDPKYLPGANFCDIGFEIDERLNRLLIMSATDNLMKGAAGNGVQCMNLMSGFDERTGLNFPGLHPV
ncbi:MAG: N-acetyl-gamma-glutamyl-phosphate reductase [Nitrososphaerota archaeon]|nr:N-acetyl-gamma-glutamyl-phosphate reductase [Nitrososphaerota archaeon]